MKENPTKLGFENSPCVTSARPRQTKSRACGIKCNWNFDEISPSTYLYIERTTGNPRRKRGVANSGKHGERTMKAFSADDGLFLARIKKIRSLISLPPLQDLFIMSIITFKACLSLQRSVFMLLFSFQGDIHSFLSPHLLAASLIKGSLPWTASCHLF